MILALLERLFDPRDLAIPDEEWGFLQNQMICIYVKATRFIVPLYPVDYNVYPKGLRIFGSCRLQKILMRYR